MLAEVQGTRGSVFLGYGQSPDRAALSPGVRQPSSHSSPQRAIILSKVGKTWKRKGEWMRASENEDTEGVMSESECARGRVCEGVSECVCVKAVLVCEGLRVSV